MLRLRKILLCNYLYYLIFLLSVIYTAIFINIKHELKLNLNSKILIGRVESISLSGNKLSLIVKNKEKVKATYYLTNKDEIHLIKQIHLGDKIRLEGEFSLPLTKKDEYSFDYERYLKTKKIYYLFKIEKLSVISSSKNIFLHIKEFVINRCKDKYLKVFILGDKSSLDSSVVRTYQDLGISHLFAISGMHVSLLSTMLLKLLKWLKVKEDNRLKIVSCILLFYLFLTTFSVSILRAVLFFICFSFNKIYYTYIDSKNIFLLVAAISLFINPFYIYDVAFIYSYSISFSLIVMANFINSFKSYFKSLFVTSLISFLVGIPTSLYFFNQLNFLSIIYNLFYVPFISYIVFPLALISFLVPQVLKVFELSVSFLEFTASTLSKITFSKLIFCSCNILIYFIYIILIIGILKLISSSNKRVVLIFILLLVFHYFIPTLFDKNYLMMIDVGQGDSILIHSKGKNMLIDTGGIETYQNKSFKSSNDSKVVINTTIPVLKKLGISKIDYLILTHGDYDHMGEAINLVNNFKVDNVIFNCGEFNELEKELIKVIDKKKIKYYSCIKELNIDNNKLYFLQTKEYDNENDNSNVIYTELDGYKFMFMGDAGVEKEKDILNKYNISGIDVLKIGHHGSKTSSSKEFINEINPNYSIISVGKNNRYGHPNKEVLNNLSDSKIYRTDQDGSIMFKIRNNKLKIKTCSS
ncbi:MAG: DNA internalization-related competence protein ComEC/Rec2 [bacterium]|nr:DNA internalization-related competence protein ComEC/Rec2 [bacterium]